MRLAFVGSLLMMLGITACVGAAETNNVARISPAVTEFLKRHCIRCHGPDEQNAELRFDKFPETIPNDTVALQWQDVLDVLNLGQMPPEGVPRPPRDEAANAIEALTANLQEARKRLTDSGGHVVLRRLNRREYERTIDALFGVPVDVTMLPNDGKVGGFDTLGQAQGFSSLHLERYLDLGRRVLDRAYDFGGKSKPRPLEQHQEPEKDNRKIAEEIPKLEQKIEKYNKSIAGGRKQHIERRAITRFEVELSKKHLDRPETKSGVLIPFRGLNPSTFVRFGGNTSEGRYRIRVQCGVANEQPVDDLFLKVVRGEYRSKVPDAVDYFHVTGTVREPQVIEFDVEIDKIRSNRFSFERRNAEVEVVEKYAEARGYYFKYKDVQFLAEDERPNLWIDWIEMEGPLKEPERPLSAKSLFGDRDPAKSSAEGLREIIRRFAYEAFRHQEPDPKYLDGLWRIFTMSRDRGTEAGEALKETLAVVLASPRFLYLHEPETAGSKKRPLTDRELAVRLAYFLWSAPPDEELYRLAEEDRLRDSQVLARQVDRMIDSKRAAAFIETFPRQWLELDRLSAIDPEGTSVPEYDDAIHRRSEQEVYTFFGTLLREDLPATNLIDSDFLVTDALLADFYGIDGVKGDPFRKVDLPEGSVRGGLLGQSAILTLTGTGDRTSPVERGAFVLRKLLHRPPPPAPANVPMLNEETIGERSIRETLAIHQSKPQCASCHRRIDPLGFALENFDPVGRWRDEVVSDNATFPIDPGGVMPDGERSFNGPVELKQRLLENRRDFLKGLTEALMTYALGRTVGFSDQETVDGIVAATAKQNESLRALVHEIVKNESFRMR